jgi:hypothetical protein
MSTVARDTMLALERELLLVRPVYFTLQHGIGVQGQSSGPRVQAGGQ